MRRKVQKSQKIHESHFNKHLISDMFFKNPMKRTRENSSRNPVIIGHTGFNLKAEIFE